MKKTVMKKWVKALRSGEFEQGQNSLKGSYGGYCCLGVLCEISGKKYNGDDVATPEHIRKYAGFVSMYDETDGMTVKEKLLATFNDSRRYSFKKIAAYIERNWKIL